MVLFVCRGNICRSPFAEYYARTIFPKSMEVMSCGYYPKKGRSSPEELVNAARAMGIDMASHRSVVISEEMVRQAEVILTFDEENRRSVIKRYPFAKRKVHRFGALSEQGPITVKDPYGGSIGDFQEVCQTIVRTLDSYSCIL
jgi:protein-tyrosine-phosphatase